MDAASEIEAGPFLGPPVSLISGMPGGVILSSAVSALVRQAREGTWIVILSSPPPPSHKSASLFPIVRNAAGRLFSARRSFCREQIDFINHEVQHLGERKESWGKIEPPSRSRRPRLLSLLNSLDAALKIRGSR